MRDTRIPVAGRAEFGCWTVQAEVAPLVMGMGDGYARNIRRFRVRCRCGHVAVRFLAGLRHRTPPAHCVKCRPRPGRRAA